MFIIKMLISVVPISKVMSTLLHAIFTSQFELNELEPEL